MAGLARSAGTGANWFWSWQKPRRCRPFLRPLPPEPARPRHQWPGANIRDCRSPRPRASHFTKHEVRGATSVRSASGSTYGGASRRSAAMRPATAIRSSVQPGLLPVSGRMSFSPDRSAAPCLLVNASRRGLSRPAYGRSWQDQVCSSWNETHVSGGLSLAKRPLKAPEEAGSCSIKSSRAPVNTLTSRAIGVLIRTQRPTKNNREGKADFRQPQSYRQGDRGNPVGVGPGPVADRGVVAALAGQARARPRRSPQP